MIKLQNKQKKIDVHFLSQGFTLLELTVAISIFALLSLFVIDIYVNISRVYMGSLDARLAQQNVRGAVETITRYIRQSTGITSISASELTLDNPTDGNVNFKLDSGVIKMTKGLQISNLTSKELNIQKFEISESPGIPIILTITIQGEIAEPKSWEKGLSGQGNIEMTTSAVLKGQYY